MFILTTLWIYHGGVFPATGWSSIFNSQRYCTEAYSHKFLACSKFSKVSAKFFLRFLSEVAVNCRLNKLNATIYLSMRKLQPLSFLNYHQKMANRVCVEVQGQNTHASVGLYKNIQSHTFIWLRYFAGPKVKKTVIFGHENLKWFLISIISS